MTEHNVNAVNEGEEWVTSTALNTGEASDVRASLLEEARHTIERVRKADATFMLTDSSAKPMTGVTAEVVQTSHQFVFGCSSGGTLAEESDPARAARNDLFAALFNGTTAKCYWDEKWHQPIERAQGQRITQTFIDEIDWGLAYGMTVRGHPLVWTVAKAIPAWVRRYDIHRQMRLMEENCRALIGAAQGRIKLWDLVNEMLWEPSLRNLPQRDWPHIETIDEILTYVAPAVEWALDEDPDSHYVLNDYGLEVDFTELKGVTAQQQRDRFVALIEALEPRGLAPGAVGTQAHCGKWFPLSTIKQTFDDLAKTGLPIQVSEFWAKAGGCPDPTLEGDALEALQCQYVHDYYTMAFGHEHVEHISYWGGEEFFTRGGYVGTPLYDTLNDLIHRQWKTETTLTSDNNGNIQFRGFKGDYVIRWRDENNRPQSRTLTVQ